MDASFWASSAPIICTCFRCCPTRASLTAVPAPCAWWSKNCGVSGCASWPSLPREFLLDTKPIPVVGYKRSKRRSEFRGSADYGYCASRNMHYFGYKLVSITTLNGLPLVYDLVPASTDEREAAEVVLDYLSGCTIYGDKGFIGEEWQLQIYEQIGNRIWTVKRVNQHEQNPKAFDRWLNSIRERVEGAFNEIQNTGRNIERLLAKTVLGVSTRVMAKMTSHALKHLLRHLFGIDVQTFEVAST
jgi:Transposase DDE domain